MLGNNEEDNNIQPVDQVEEQQQEEAVVEVPPIITIPPPSGNERLRHAVLGISRRHYLLLPPEGNPHYASCKFEAILLRAVEVCDGKSLEQCFTWVCTVVNSDDPKWVLLEGVDGAQGSHVRAIVGAEIKKKVCTVLKSYRNPDRFTPAKDRLRRVANTNNVVATAVNEAAALNWEDGIPEDGNDYGFSSVLVVGNVGGGDDEDEDEDDSLSEFGGLDGGEVPFGDDEDPPAAAPPQGGNGWGKKRKLAVGGIVTLLLCYTIWLAKNVLGDIFSSSGADSNSMNGSIGEGNVSSPPSNITTRRIQSEEEGVTNGTDSSGFSYTVESVGIVMPLLYQRLEMEGMNRKLQDTVATYEAKETQQLARIETLEAGATQQLARIETYEAKETQQLARIETYEAKETQQLARIERLEAGAAQQLARIETYEAKETQRLARIKTLEAKEAQRLARIERLEVKLAHIANMAKVFAVCLVICVCGGALASIIKKNGNLGDSDGEQQPTSGGEQQPAPDLVHANSTDSDTLAGETASSEIPSQHGGRRNVLGLSREAREMSGLEPL